MSQGTKFKTFAEYLKTQPAQSKKILTKIRKIIQSQVPLAEETISYQLPAFRLGRTFIYFAGFKNHIGIYPPIKRDRALLRELRPYLNEKNNLKFSLAEPIPYELISRVALTLSMEYAKPSR